MPANHLEQLVAEWYQLQGYFVRRNVQVGKRRLGGYECELDLVCFHPQHKHLIHIEPSLDCHSWKKREERYRKKFEAGRRYIPHLFKGLYLPETLEQVALFVYGGGNRKEFAGGKVMFVREFMRIINEDLKKRKIQLSAIPEEYPLLRSLQFAAQYWQ
ncbi:MAG: hypothetical protein PHW10_04490 [Candidatus Peribacteraceae bacterium]|nr:hypothetical protein [Candidatus Peribacteraceae bacterium]